MRIRQSSSRGWQGALHAGLFALALRLGGVTSFLQAGLACHRVQLTLPAQQRLQTLERGRGVSNDAPIPARQGGGSSESGAGRLRSLLDTRKSQHRLPASLQRDLSTRLESQLLHL